MPVMRQALGFFVRLDHNGSWQRLLPGPDGSLLAARVRLDRTGHPGRRAVHQPNAITGHHRLNVPLGSTPSRHAHCRRPEQQSGTNPTALLNPWEKK